MPCVSSRTGSFRHDDARQRPLLRFPVYSLLSDDSPFHAAPPLCDGNRTVHSSGAKVKDFLRRSIS
jgi:hypothetical protein